MGCFFEPFCVSFVWRRALEIDQPVHQNSFFFQLVDALSHVPSSGKHVNPGEHNTTTCMPVLSGPLCHYRYIYIYIYTYIRA